MLSDSDKKYSLKRLICNRYTFSALLLIILIASAILYWVYISPRFHTVIPQQVYRSSEMTVSGFEQYIKRYGIRSVINLRGAGENDLWYENEMAAVAATHVTHYDFKLKSHEKPTRAQLKALVRLIQQAPKPVLIHCKNGSDRTGLASAVALIIYDKPNLDAIKKQYSLIYGALSPTSVGKLVIPVYLQWLEQQPHHGPLKPDAVSFQQWLDATSILSNS